jgi:hypothetical protein
MGRRAPCLESGGSWLLLFFGSWQCDEEEI